MSRTQSARRARTSLVRARIARWLMLLAGAIGSFGVLFFTVIQPDNDNLDALGWSVAALLAIGSIGYVVSAVRLGRANDTVWRFAMAFAVLRLALSIFKVAYYAESDAVLFLVIDAVVVGLLSNRGAFVRRGVITMSRPASHIHLERRRAA